jgi:F-type H+-transporting ATPase subunit b
MDINATLLGQALVFGILIWFSWKFIWPPLVKAIEDRQKKIAEGLAAAERGQTELQSAHGAAQKFLEEAREQAKRIVDQAHKREVEIVDEARTMAVEEGKRIIDASRQDAQQEKARARDELRRDVATLAVAGASRLLQREIDARAHAELIEQLAREIEGAKA